MIPVWKRGRRTKVILGQRLRDIREGYELTQTSIAKIIGCTPSAISTLELGKFGSLELADAYAWAMGLELRDI